MQRSTSIRVAVIVLILACLVVYVALQPTPAKAPVVTGKYAENTACFDITATYATSTSLRERASAVAVAGMKQFVDDTVTQFKSDISPCSVQSLKATLQMSYLAATSARTVSYMFTIYQDTGGAHGNTFYHTFAFDMQTGTPLALKDLFVPNAPYLDTFSNISRTKLPSIIDKQSFVQSMLDAGTTPDDKNFENFFLDGKSLVVLFPPYAVAPYSAGPQTLAIPVTDLKSILKLEYQ